MAVPECGAKSLQASYVPGELENPEDPEDPEYLSCFGEVLEGVVRVEVVEEEGDVEGENAKQVDHIQEGDGEEKLKRRDICSPLNWLTRFYLAWCNNEPDEIFKSEPANENCLGDSEKVVFFLVGSFLGLFLDGETSH